MKKIVPKIMCRRSCNYVFAGHETNCPNCGAYVKDHIAKVKQDILEEDRLENLQRFRQESRFHRGNTVYGLKGW